MYVHSLSDVTLWLPIGAFGFSLIPSDLDASSPLFLPAPVYITQMY